MSQIEITINEVEEGYRVQIIEGDVINRRHHVDDEYEVGELITEYLGESKHE